MTGIEPRHSVVLMGTFVFLTIIVLLAPFGYSSPETTVSIADYSEAKGETVYVYVEVSEAEMVGSMDITIVYDPIILELEEVSKSDLTDHGIVEYNVEGGAVKVLVNVLDGFSGSGKVASLMFVVVGDVGSSCEVSLTNVEANHAETFVDILLSIENGSFLVKPPKISSSITCSASPVELVVEETVTVTGSLEPAKEGITVTIEFNKPDGTKSSMTTTTSADGAFELEYSPDSVGDWTVASSWEGDSSHSGAASQPASFTVEEASGGGGIPGFPYESILLGIIVGILILWRLRG